MIPLQMLIKVLATRMGGKNNNIREIKLLGLGKDDIQTADQLAPYGVDHNPIKNMIGFYSTTANRADKVICGYINRQHVTEPGEIRLFSTDDDGIVKYFVYVKKNGSCELGGPGSFNVKLKEDNTAEIGGNTDWMVRYSKLEEAFNELKADHNDLVGKFNDLVGKWNSFCTGYIPGSPSITGEPATLAGATASTDTPSTADITPAKIVTIKTL